jgi:hypothetical protein
MNVRYELSWLGTEPGARRAMYRSVLIAETAEQLADTASDWAAHGYLSPMSYGLTFDGEMVRDAVLQACHRALCRVEDTTWATGEVALVTKAGMQLCVQCTNVDWNRG